MGRKASAGQTRAAGTPATAALERASVAYSAHAYEHDPRSTSYGLEAAEALALDPALVYKTLLADVDGVGLAVGVVPVTGQLDLKALAAALGAKRATMADPAAAQRSTGMIVGGISPFGQKRQLPTVLDQSAVALPKIYVSGGRRGLDLGVTPGDLVALLDAKTAAIARVG